MQAKTNERKNDNNIIWITIIGTIVLIILIYYAEMFLLYAPPLSREEKKAQKMSAAQKEQEQNRLLVEQINSIEGDLKNSFKTIGQAEACKEILNEGVGGETGLWKFPQYYGGTIDFEEEKSCYHYMEGKAVIDDAVKMLRIALRNENEVDAYILMEIPYSIECTKVSGDSMYSDYKKYENTTVGSGVFYPVITLSDISLEDNTLKADGYNKVERFSSFEEADSYLKSMTGNSAGNKTFDFD